MEPARQAASEVLAALERVLGSAPFSHAPRMGRFLRHIVEKTLDGSREQLSGYGLGLDVFDRDASFDPSLDSIVRVEARRLRSMLDEYYRSEGLEDPIEISLPKGSYVPIFKARPRQQGPRATTRIRPDGGPSIAVLPFQNYSGDPDDQFFADGLTEETIANLSRFKDLFVFSRSTTTKLARDGADIRQLHEELGTDLVLESSVRRSSHSVRVTTQLIDAVTDGHILAEQFERPCTPDGIFEIQDEIARLVAGRVADRYGPLGRYATRAARSGRSRRWETYLWIVRFYDYYSKHLPHLHLEVRDGLEAALELDPGSSDAWAALAAIYLDEYRLHLNERGDLPALDRALEIALRSVACDPDNAMAHQFLAIIYYHRQEIVAFETAAQRALELNPGHADALADIGFCFAYAGQWDKGLALIDCALEISPVHPGWYHTAPACRKLLDGDPDAALREIKKVPMPGFYWYHALMACFHGWAGHDVEAADEARALFDVFPDFATTAQRECRIWTANEEFIEKIMQGWRKAGMLRT